MTQHVTVAAILEKDGKYLFVEEIINGERLINQPAGHLELNESLVDAVIRETYEETGWHVTAKHLVGIYQLHNKTNSDNYLRFCFYCEALSHDKDAELDKEIVCTHWLSYSELLASKLKHRSVLVLQSLDDHIKGMQYPLSIVQLYEHN